MLREGLTIVADKLKCSIEQPINKKYRDAASFQGEVLAIIERANKSKKAAIILVEDAENNDLAYVDFLVNHIQ